MFRKNWNCSDNSSHFFGTKFHFFFFFFFFPFNCGICKDICFRGPIVFLVVCMFYSVLLDVKTFDYIL